MSAAIGSRLKQRPTLEWEKRLGFPKLLIAGVDEVGRGCLAGPVVAGAVILPSSVPEVPGVPVVNGESHSWVSEIQDSKKLTPQARERLAPLIENWSLAWAIGYASREEIDRINIYHATHLAMCRAIAGLSSRPQKILVDGNVVPKGLPVPGTAVVKGDMKCLSIAAASILAKVWRDQRMVEAEQSYPGYGFSVHKGYATPAHSKALAELGPCEIHRRSFAPVAVFFKNLAQASEASPLSPAQSSLF